MTNTVCLAWVEFAGQPAELFAATLTDGTAAALVTLEASAGLGDFAGQTVTRVTVQVGDGSICSTVEVVDAAGGQLAQWIGGERGVAGSSAYGSWNMKTQPVALKVERGMSLKVLAAN